MSFMNADFVEELDDRKSNYRRDGGEKEKGQRGVKSRQGLKYQLVELVLG